MNVEAGKLRLASLEFFLTDRCNLRCEHCSASSPYLRESNLPDLETFRQDLGRLERVLRSDQLKFLGGEPLLHRSICDFLRVARASGIFARIRVATNGYLLPRMSDDFWRLTDVVEVSQYPGVEHPDAEELALVRDRAERHGTRLELNAIGQFMLPFSEVEIEDPRQVEQIFHSCGEAHEWSCHLLYRSRLYRCSRVHTLDRYLDLRRIPHAAFTELDGLPIDDRPSLLDDLAAYLTSPTPLNACRHCLGTSGRWVANSQISGSDARERLEEPPRKLEEGSIVGPGEAHLRRRTVNWAAARAMTKRV